MRYEDIPQFIQSSGYEIDVPLSHLESTLNDFKESNLQMEPDFQRGHVWTEKQQIAFVEFLLRGGRSGLTCYFNHPNWQSTRLDIGDFVCVDGLQRITACLRFVRGEIGIFGGHFASEFTDRMPIHARLRFVVNSLPTRADVLRWYVELNSGGTVHEEAEIERVKKLLELETA